MDILIVPVPIFNDQLQVEAYCFLSQKGNELLNVSRNTRLLDGAMRSPVLETLNQVGLEAFTMNKPAFVPVDQFLLRSNMEQQCSLPLDKLVFLLDGKAGPMQLEVQQIERLKKLGFRIAIQNLVQLEPFADILTLCDYILFHHRETLQPVTGEMVQALRRLSPGLIWVASSIQTTKNFEAIREQKTYTLYEGTFYRNQVTGPADKKVSPLQANLIKLLNLVRDESFEFSQVTEIVQRDTALSISLLRMVNSPYMGLANKIKSINHAVTMLGQLEVRKWVTTAVTRSLGADKPDEITRLSLLRAKWAENLAPLFDLRAQSQSLFLMGLFSVLDVILDLPMSQALKLVRVSDALYQVLVNQEGEYSPVYQYILQYEGANWQSVSRLLILYDITVQQAYDAYVDACMWYRDLLSGSLD